MTPNIAIHRQDGLPCPCIYLATPDLLADWYRRQLEDALARGERDLRLHCFNGLGDWPPIAGAYAVLRMAADFLHSHPQAGRLDLYCAGEDCYKAYCFQWNMWFAESKPDRR